jgi:hypothetical protein
MRIALSRSGDAVALTSVLIAGVGGVFFGLSSCGGVRWHGQAFLILATALTLIAMAIPSTFLTSWARRVLFVLLIIGAYQLTLALTAPFYPSTPGSLLEYARLVVGSVMYGPC